MANERDDKNYAALILSRSALRRWTDLYAKLQNECGEVVSRKLDYNLPPADHVPALEAIDAALSATTPPTDPLGWVTMTDKRVSDPVYRTREDAEKDADLLRARGIDTKVAGVYLAPQSAGGESRLREELRRLRQWFMDRDDRPGHKAQVIYIDGVLDIADSAARSASVAWKPMDATQARQFPDISDAYVLPRSISKVAVYTSKQAYVLELPPLPSAPTDSRTVPE